MTHTNEDLLALADRLDKIEIYSVREHLSGLGTRPIEAANNDVCEAAAALRVLVAERQAIRDKALGAILADDETCLRLAEGYDREDAAQHGEPSLCFVVGDGYSEWALGRVSCAKEGLRAAIRAMKGTTE